MEPPESGAVCALRVRAYWHLGITGRIGRLVDKMVAVTETTATRLAAAIEKQRKRCLYRHPGWCAGSKDGCATHWKEDRAALARLEKLCVAQGRWEEFSAIAGEDVKLAEIEALLREET